AMTGVEEGRGVDGHVLPAHLEVQMRSGRSAGGADPSDRRPALDRLSGLDEEGGEVGIAAAQPATVIDLDQIAVACSAAGEDNLATAGAEHRRAARRREVDAGMEGFGAGEGIAAVAEVGAPARRTRK